jgi:anti-sigma factor ChrR (cupin superfamily)
VKLNADLTRRAAVHAAGAPWQASPVVGVERQLLHRWGDEVAQATSLVRYAPGSHFSPHLHTGGEEFLVLEGTFQDEHGDYPAGSYVRNPPGTRHTPRSADGTVLFVKLWQFDPQDRKSVHVRTDTANPQRDGAPAGASVVPLFADDHEEVRLEQWSAGSLVEVDLLGGGEFLVLGGGFVEQGEDFSRWSWLRLPAGHRLQAMAGSEGATVWVKQGLLPRLAQLALPPQA